MPLNGNVKREIKKKKKTAFLLSLSVHALACIIWHWSGFWFVRNSVSDEKWPNKIMNLGKDPTRKICQKFALVGFGAIVLFFY